MWGDTGFEMQMTASCLPLGLNREWGGPGWCSLALVCPHLGRTGLLTQCIRQIEGRQKQKARLAHPLPSSPSLPQPALLRQRPSLPTSIKQILLSKLESVSLLDLDSETPPSPPIASSVATAKYQLQKGESQEDLKYPTPHWSWLFSIFKKPFFPPHLWQTLSSLSNQFKGHLIYETCPSAPD